MDDKRHLSQYGIHREESSHRAGCAAPLDEFFVKDKDGVRWLRSTLLRSDGCLPFAGYGSSRC